MNVIGSKERDGSPVTADQVEVKALVSKRLNINWWDINQFQSAITGESLGVAFANSARSSEVTPRALIICKKDKSNIIDEERDGLVVRGLTPCLRNVFRDKRNKQYWVYYFGEASLERRQSVKF